MSQKHSKKLGKKFFKNARNVLAVPKESFWPILEYPECSSFLTVFQSALKNARTIQPQIPWSELKRLSKEIRKEKIKEFYENLSEELSALHRKAMILRKDLTIGVNDVARGLEKNELACCILSGDVIPKLLISHIADLAKVKKVPILIINSLKERIKESLGFPSIAVGFKNSVVSHADHDFHEICREIITLFNKSYSFGSCEDIENEEEKEVYKFFKDETSVVIPSPTDFNLNEIYLYRNSSDYRVFKPSEISNVPTHESKEDAKMIIDFAMEQEENDKVTSAKKGRYYDPPIIKRVQSNPSKWKKKKKKT